MRGTYIKKTARSAAPSPLNPLNLQNLLNPLSPPALHEKIISPLLRIRGIINCISEYMIA